MSGSAAACWEMVLHSTSISNDERDTGYKFFGGYQFNKNFSLESGYFDLGNFDFTATTLPAGTLNGKIRLKGLNLDVVGILPITEKFSAFGRAGLNYADARDSFTGTGAVGVVNPNPSKRDMNYKFGLGLQYALTESLGIRAEAERYRINDAVGNKGDIDLCLARPGLSLWRNNAGLRLPVGGCFILPVGGCFTNTTRDLHVGSRRAGAGLRANPGAGHRAGRDADRGVLQHPRHPVRD